MEFSSSSSDQIRYARHVSLPEIGEQGQARLARSKVSILGVGGLGSPVALYLAAAGVGTLQLVDDDHVALSNLQRQVLYSTDEIGKKKVYAARDRLGQLNPSVQIRVREERIGSENIDSLIGDSDMVVDGTDGFSTRYVINDACVRLKKPLAYGAIFRFDGQASLFVPGGPCYRCLYPKPAHESSALSCELTGVLGTLPGLVGMIQATEALKYLLEIDGGLRGKLLIVDALKMSFETVAISRRANCPACGEGSREKSFLSDPSFPRVIGGDELQARRSELIVLDLRGGEAYSEGHIPGARVFDLPPSEAISLPFGFQDELVVYCKSGSTSARVVEVLRERGYVRARELSGGYNAWARAFRP